MNEIYTTSDMFLPVTDRILAVIPRIPGALLTLVVGYIIIKILQALATVSLKSAHVTKAMQDILLSTLSVILWIGVLALTLQAVGLNQIAIALTSSVAVIGLGIATGANKLVSDILAGLFLARSRDFKIGQFIKIGDVEGKIYSLDSRKVRIMAQDGTLYIIPNTKFDEQTWQVPPSSEKGKA